MNRSLLLLATLVCASAVQAQTANPVSTELKQAYTGVKNNLIGMAEKMPEDQYGFKPADTIRSFGQMVAHVADAQGRYCGSAMGEAKAINAASKTSKADLVAALKQSFEVCDAAYDGLTDAKGTEMVKFGRGERTRMGVLISNLSHSNEEYGYMAVYLRLKGVVPPSSEKR